MKDVVVIGFGGHAKSVIDTIEKKNDYRIVGYTDVEDKGEYRGYRWLGTDDVLKDLFESGVENAVISLGYISVSFLRDDLYNYAKRIGFSFPIIIDDTAIIASDVSVGEGTFIGKGAIIDSASTVGKMCIINTGAIIEHDNIIGDFSHIAVGAVLCGEVSTGTHCLIGANSTIIQCRKIGNRCIVGANSVVLKDIDDDEKCFGVVK